MAKLWQNHRQWNGVGVELNYSGQRICKVKKSCLLSQWVESSVKL